MKASKVLLRWFKSFNTNYTSYADRRPGVVTRPWNSLRVESGSANDYEFIEIPLESDITTVVGGNESGKSHLLGAVSKVITGDGIPDGDGQRRAFARTDLCHFASVRSKNAEVWPNIGLEFASLTTAEANAVKSALGSGAGIGGQSLARFTLILAPEKDGESGVFAYFYPDSNGTALSLNKAQLAALRNVLPEVRFIQSDVPIADHVPITSLLAAMGSNRTGSEKRYYDHLTAQRAAEIIQGLSVTKERPLNEGEIAQISEIKKALSSAPLLHSGEGLLEAQLFGDVLGIAFEAVECLSSLKEEARSYGEGLVALWNTEIERKLNLSHYWQQDDLFSLRLNYKRGILFFEITDKTGSVYTFRERSSGLRYFLSYYIQAKALETATRDKNCIILMDEPDSYLSIIGQRNLLSVFESLVSADTSRKNTQLLYTTHSPFLINRNFPRRIRLVRKGDAEEGTQYVDESRLRRYEPVRSALGIDCAQTLFMGATNVVFEGPTDQYLVSELIRAFTTPDNVNDFLDLNSVILVSAESASGVEKLLAASRWGDERVPATVVVFDNDDAGRKHRDRVVGKARSVGKLIDEEFALLISEAIGDKQGSQATVTTEDLLPSPLYAKAVTEYVRRWFPDAHEERGEKVAGAVLERSFGSDGVVASSSRVFAEFVHADRDTYDKLGVLQEAVRLINQARDGSPNAAPAIEELELRVRRFCRKLREKIELSQQAERRETGKQAIVRVIREFFIKHRESAGTYDVELVLVRLGREAELLGEDAMPLKTCLGKWLEELRNMRAEKQVRLTGEAWTRWKTRITAVRKDPLNVGEPAPSVALELPNAPEPTQDTAASGDGAKTKATGRASVAASAESDS